MKRQIIVTVVGILMLISLAQLGTLTTAAAYLQQKCQLKAESINERDTISSSTTGAEVAGAGGNSHNLLFRAGATPTPSEIDLQVNITTVHVGDAVVVPGKLIDKNTGKGIPGATVTMQISVDQNIWVSAGNSVKTDTNGNIKYPLTVPDPRSYGYSPPLKVYCRMSYDGSSTYAPASSIFSVTVLPSTSTTAF